MTSTHVLVKSRRFCLNDILYFHRILCFILQSVVMEDKVIRVGSRKSEVFINFKSFIVFLLLHLTTPFFLVTILSLEIFTDVCYNIC